MHLAHWSIAQTKNRETKPEELGWKLFQNYLTALKKFKPDYFLYENNKSMSCAIREQISKEFGFEPILINSALVSAQNRQRLYWAGQKNEDDTYGRVFVKQPEDRGLILRDILEDNLVSYDISGYEFITGETTESGNVEFLGGFAAPGQSKWLEDGKSYSRNFSQGKRLHGVDRKSVTVTAQASGLAGHAGLYAVPCSGIPKSDSPVRVCNINGGGQGNRIYSSNAKSCAIKAQGGGLVGHGQGLYAIPLCLNSKSGRNGVDGLQPSLSDRIYSINGKSTAVTTAFRPNIAVPHETDTDENNSVYEVKNGQIIIKGKTSPIALQDGFYIIRKLTVRECMRLQTVPEDYIFPVSNSQAYKMLGNGWTCDVITHILSHCPGITEEPLSVLSMYDGMSCGRIALNKLGANIVQYYAAEIDPYAIKTTLYNFPDTIQLGDAYQVRDPNRNIA